MIESEFMALALSIAQSAPESEASFLGARLKGDGVAFRVWAPRHESVSVILEGNGEEQATADAHPLKGDGQGYFSGSIPGMAAQALYRYRLGEDETLYPDPASCFQPQGPHGPSQVIDLASFVWTDENWQGIPPRDHIVYEMHIGTFTPEGSWKAAAEELAELKALGITTIEVMPIADFCGRFGWGYDGVNMFAPCRLYGKPEEVAQFVNRAHEVGLAVILDVVYNHLGPDGNFMTQFAAEYFSKRHKSEWGDTLNFDDDKSESVREYFLTNVRHWIADYHFDGLRLDATGNLFDDSPRHIMADIAAQAREAGDGRQIWVVGENEAQETHLLHDPKHGGYGLHALANDDFHHASVVALTGRNEAYYTDYYGNPQEFISLAKRNYLYQGQRYEWQDHRRGTSAFDLKPQRFINYLENHDQVANSGRGYRLHMQSAPGSYRAMTAVLLLFPQIPMLFQGQEFGSSRSFYYFADHGQELAQKVGEGRKEFLAQFASLATEEMRDLLPDPADPETFVHSKLDLKERHLHAKIYALHKDLLRLRREEKIFTDPAHGLDGAVLGAHAFVLRYFGETYADDRLLLVNLGRDLRLRPAPEPLLAPAPGMRWALQWHTEEPRYGGAGTAEPDGPKNWYLPGHAALIMKPEWLESVSSDKENSEGKKA